MASKWESIELHSYFKRYFSYLKEKKKKPPKDDRFTTDKMGFSFHLVTLEVSLFICNEVEPFLTLFSRRTAIGSIFVRKVKRITNLEYRKIHWSAVFAASSSTQKILKIDLKKEKIELF